MAAVEMTGALDLWTLLVYNVFGSLFLTVIGITLVLFIITGVLGRMSIYSATMYCVLFLFVMGLGTGTNFLNILVMTLLLLGLFYSVKGYQDRAGQ